MAGTLLVGLFFTVTFNNIDFIFYAIGTSLGLSILNILVKTVISIAENTYVAVLLKNDLVEATNKNSTLLEALLVISEREDTANDPDEIKTAEPETHSIAETFESITSRENIIDEKE